MKSRYSCVTYLLCLFVYDALPFLAASCRHFIFDSVAQLYVQSTWEKISNNCPLKYQRNYRIVEDTRKKSQKRCSLTCSW